MRKLKAFILVAFMILATTIIPAQTTPKKKAEYTGMMMYDQALTLINKISHSNLVGKDEAAEQVEKILFDLYSKNRK